ncbi:mutator type transposase [Tanacetum coccineum]
MLPNILRITSNVKCVNGYLETTTQTGIVNPDTSIHNTRVYYTSSLAKNLVNFKVPETNVDNAVKAKAKAAISLRGNVKIQYALLDLEKVVGSAGCDGVFMRGRIRTNADSSDDFDLYSNSNFTFITDRQKGLLPALEKLFPHAEHRYCVRHIYENMNLTWKGSEYKEMLWKCASSTTTVMFEKNMQELKDFNKKAYEWLKQIPAEHWSRAYFSGLQQTVVRSIGIVLSFTALECEGLYIERGVVTSNGLVLVGKVGVSGTYHVACHCAIHDMADKRQCCRHFLSDWVLDSSKLATWKAIYSHMVTQSEVVGIVSKFDWQQTNIGQGGTSNAAGVGTQPSEGETSNAAGVGPLASQDVAYWDSYSPTTDEKEVPLGKYIPIGKHAAARPIIKSEAFQTGVVLGVALSENLACHDEKLRIEAV